MITYVPLSNDTWKETIEKGCTAVIVTMYVLL